MARKLIEKDFKFVTEDHSGGKELPALLKDFRKKSREIYHSTAFPTMKDEAWRRTALRDLPLDVLELANGQTVLKEDRDGRIISSDLLKDKSWLKLSASSLQVKISDQMREAGIVISDLETAAEEHPLLLKKILGQVVSPEEGKFAAAAGAFATQGVFIYVPEKLQVEEDLFLIVEAPGASTAHFAQVLVYLDRDSSLTLVSEYHSPGGDKQQSLTAENLEVIVGENAHLTMLELQTYSEDSWSFGHKKAVVERDGSLDWVLGSLGGRLTKHFVTVDLNGKGAEGRISGMFFANNQQHISYNTLQRHLAPRTNSDLLFKGGLTGSSRSVWRGMIYVAPGAQYIDGYQANRNLILSESARSDSIPGLEIHNNDVRCTHGSTVGKLDQEQLFYLRSRGIPRSEAEKIIIQGFFDSILSRVDFPEIQERLWTAVEDKLSES
jgi:Fe-S cluster assembly protein SufD